MAQVKLFVPAPGVYSSEDKEAISKAEIILHQWMRRRYIALSASRGAGAWPNIASSTLARKKRKALRGEIQAKPWWIMRENNNILSALDVQRATQGGVKGFEIGVLRDRAHSSSKMTVGQLATILNPRWAIVEQPPPAVLARMGETVKRTTESREQRQTRLTTSVLQSTTGSYIVSSFSRAMNIFGSSLSGMRSFIRNKFRIP